VLFADYCVKISVFAIPSSVFLELHPLRSLVTSVLGYFGLFLKVRSDQGPNWPRTELP